MKLCVICGHPIESDVTFSSRHNICRKCLTGGQDIECLNNPDIQLAEWEKENLKPCKDCGRNFVPLWYGIKCTKCAERSREQVQIQQKLDAERLQVIQLGKTLRFGITNMRNRYLQCQKVIQRFERAAEKRIKEKQTKRQKVIDRRIKKFFGNRKPFDIATLCRVAIDKSSYNLGDRYYDRMYRYFVEGLSISEITPFGKEDLERDMGIACCAVYHPKFSWLFKPVKRRPKEEKQQELKDRIADIVDSQSRIDAPEIKE